MPPLRRSFRIWTGRFLLRPGWSAYFSYGALASAYEAVDQHVYDRTRNFLRKRHKVQGRGTDQFSRDHVYGELAVRCLRRERGRSSPWALRGSQSESRMREIRTSGFMSGEGKRGLRQRLKNRA